MRRSHGKTDTYAGLRRDVPPCAGQGQIDGAEGPGAPLRGGERRVTYGHADKGMYCGPVRPWHL